MKLVPLTPDHELTPFDCGDSDLNEFLFNDAKKAQELRIANTFILEDDGCIAAYFCLLNDRISRNEITGSRWKKIKASFPVSKQFRSYPCIKVGFHTTSRSYPSGLFVSVCLVGMSFFLIPVPTLGTVGD